MTKILYYEEDCEKGIEYEVSISPLPENCWKCPFYDWGDDVCNATRGEEFEAYGCAVYRAKTCPFGTNFKEKES